MYSVTALFLHRNPGHNVKTTLIKTIVKVKIKNNAPNRIINLQIKDKDQ